LRFAVERLSPNFPQVPIVYGAAFEPGVDFSALPKNVSGRSYPLPFAPTPALARALQPEAQRVVLVAGSSPADSLLLATALHDLTPLLAGMQLVVWRDWTYESLFQQLRTVPPRTITILSGFSGDRSGQRFHSGDLIASVTRVASGPVYGIARNWVGDGVVGGATLDFGDDGTRTGRLLLQDLHAGYRTRPLARGGASCLRALLLHEDRGLGNGLAIVRSIVERNRGRVLAANAEGGGAVFRVQLPMASANSLRERARARDAREPSTTG
jgi:hypothetical protein